MCSINIDLKFNFPTLIKFLYIIFLMVHGGDSVFAQEQSDSKWIKQSERSVLFDSALHLYDAKRYTETQQLTIKALNACHFEIQDSLEQCCQIALLHSKASLKINESNKEFEKSRDLLRTLVKNCDQELDFIDRIIIHMNLSNFYYSEGNKILSRKEMSLCKKIINDYKIESRGSAENSEMVNHINILVRIGRYSRSTFDDYEGAIGVYEKALLIYNMHQLNSSDLFVRILTELGYTYFLLRKYDKVMNYYNAAWDVVNKVEGSKDNLFAYVCSLIGKFHLHQGNFELAYGFFEKGLVQAKLNKSADYPNHCNNLGFYYDSIKNYSKAIEYFTEALNYNDNSPSKDRLSSSEQYLYLGRVYIRMGAFGLAIQCFENDVQILKRQYGERYYKLLFSYENLGDAHCLMSRSKNSDSLLNVGINYYQASIELIGELVVSSEDLLLKKKVLKNAHSIGTKYLQWIYQKSIDRKGAIEEENEVWEVVEFLHNTLLLQNKLESDALHESHIPDSLLITLNRLNLEISALQYNINEYQNDKRQSVGDTAILIQRNMQRVKTDSVGLMKAYISEHYPEYIQWKDSLNSTSIVSIQSLLEPDQTLLDFSCTDTLLFIFIIKRNQYKLIVIPVFESLDELTQRFNRAIYAYHLKTHTNEENYATLLNDYTHTAVQLYNILLAPISAELTEELIIIPDAKFGDLAFDALLLSNPSNNFNFSSFPFLVKKHNIHYNFSASLMEKMQGIKYIFNSDHRMLAMAPFYEREPGSLKKRLNHPDAIRFGITELPYSGPEVNAIKKIYQSSSKILLGDKASRSSFLELAPKYQILHLATHGKANFEDGGMSFVAFKSTSTDRAFDLITGVDFQSTRLNADLVVLSACETAVGEYHVGNGTISIASAIAASGVKSIVASLFKVNDKSTMQLMRNFYTELNLGKSKSKALRQSKIKYLNSASPANKHPFYWASFNLYGDFKEISR